jgi:hypothetical protein
MSICVICRGNHHAASCRHRGPPQGPARSESGSAPVPLTADQLDDLAYRAKENRPFTRAEKEALIAMARERNRLKESAKQQVLDDGAMANFYRLQHALMSLGGKRP